MSAPPSPPSCARRALAQIGTEVARRCQALDMVTIGFDPLVTEDKAAAVGVKLVPLATLFATADFITLHT